MTLRKPIVLASLTAVFLLGAVLPAAASAAFGFESGVEGFGVRAGEENGSADRQAGSHPYALTTEVNFNLAPESPGEPGVPFSEGDVRDLRLDLPPGLIENPAALPTARRRSSTLPGFPASRERAVPTGPRSES